MSINELNSIIKDNERVVVKFGASWCGPCRAIKPVFEEIKKEYSNVVFEEIDIDNNEDISMEFGIMSVPTILFFKNGAFLDRLVGLTNKNDIKGFLDK